MTLIIRVIRALLFTCILFGHNALANDDLLQLLKSGNHIALIRHALAPGTSDPANFSLRDCTTQRNLDDRGRSQSVATGEFFRAKGVEFEAVYSSQWCRCLETAKLMGLGPVVEMPVLNSFFQSMNLSDERTQQLREWLTGQTIDEPIILVTHQVNITALTGVYASSGEVVIVELTESGQVQVKGTIDPR